jgi:hypothetical protein
MKFSIARSMSPRFVSCTQSSCSTMSQTCPPRALIGTPRVFGAASTARFATAVGFAGAFVADGLNAFLAGVVAREGFLTPAFLTLAVVRSAGFLAGLRVLAAIGFLAGALTVFGDDARFRPGFFAETLAPAFFPGFLAPRAAAFLTAALGFPGLERAIFTGAFAFLDPDFFFTAIVASSPSRALGHRVTVPSRLVEPRAGYGPRRDGATRRAVVDCPCRGP